MVVVVAVEEESLVGVVVAAGVERAGTEANSVVAQEENMKRRR